MGILQCCCLNGLLEIGGLGVQMIPSKVARAKRRRTAVASRQRAFMSDRRRASVSSLSLGSILPEAIEPVGARAAADDAGSWFPPQRSPGPFYTWRAITLKRMAK